MYKQQPHNITSISVNTSIEGETIEQKVERIVNNKEPINDGAPIIYSQRSAGVEPAYDIRTDRWEIAVDAMDQVSKSHTAKREARMTKIEGGKGEGKGDGKPESIQGQDNTQEGS